MLVLQRKSQEKIYLTLPDKRSVMIQVCRIDGHKVRIGIEAPDDVVIHRDAPDYPERDVLTAWGRVPLGTRDARQGGCT